MKAKLQSYNLAKGALTQLQRKKTCVSNHLISAYHTDVRRD
jgi:hypothetical protein